jgi:hypothetical protein
VQDDTALLTYEALTSGSGYVRPVVLLEFGARSTGEPSEKRPIKTGPTTSAAPRAREADSSERYSARKAGHSRRSRMCARRALGGRVAAAERSCSKVSTFAREGRFDYLLMESTGVSKPLPVEEPRLGRRTVLTFPLLPPPQKN